jgi:predicted esterase
MKQGKAINASLEHVIFYLRTTKSSLPTIVALHGRGTDEQDLLPLVESLVGKNCNGLRGRLVESNICQRNSRA